jgi:hypothetical protein
MSETGSISDGYHTFDELYEHRFFLYLAFLRACPLVAWKSRYHADGTMYDGWFIVGAELPDGQISYHLPLRLWELTHFLEEVPCAPAWDGHTADDVLKRLAAFITARTVEAS